jgi:hypothetical protein
VRFEVVGALWGTLQLTESARLVNINNTGALIESRLALPVEAVQAIRLMVGDEETRVDARVRHVRRTLDSGDTSLYLIGLEFLSPPPLLRSFVQGAVRGDFPAV